MEQDTMRAIDFHICDWLGGWNGDPDREATLASLRIDAGPENARTCFTEVYDASSLTVRKQINISAYALARWLLVNWWRLRWESPRRDNSWLYAHSLAAIGEGFAWPPLVISSDGEFIQVQACAEETCDVAAIRYLTDATLDVPAADFEVAVDSLVDQVRERLSVCREQDRDLRELQDELATERSNPELARACRLQATAGIDPGEAPDNWLCDVEELERGVGPAAINELVAALPRLPGGLLAAGEAVEILRTSHQEIDLSWLRPPVRHGRSELPWQRGTRMAVAVRKQLGQESGPLANSKLAECLGAKLPMHFSELGALQGGYRQDKEGRAKVTVPSARIERQRFHLARVMAGALFASEKDRFLAVTDTGTAMQKCERAFAQELLCPWCDLDAFTDKKGLEEDAIAAAAEYFQVSDWTIRSALVNKHKLPRERLPTALR
ncbi:MAG: hypothetical protein WC708_15710 [Lentisphaeria bacterium]